MIATTGDTWPRELKPLIISVSVHWSWEYNENTRVRSVKETDSDI